MVLEPETAIIFSEAQQPSYLGVSAKSWKNATGMAKSPTGFAGYALTMSDLWMASKSFFFALLIFFGFPGCKASTPCGVIKRGKLKSPIIVLLWENHL